MNRNPLRVHVWLLPTALLLPSVVAGCTGQMDFATDLRAFIADLARSALAAFLL